MQLATSRLWIAAGVALAAASVITATQVTPPLSDVQVPAVRLTSGFDPIAEWGDVFNAASANATDIWDHVSPAPFPALAQVLGNFGGYLGETINSPSTITDIPTQIQDNLTAARNAATDPFEPSNPASYIYPSLDTTPSAATIGLSFSNGAFGQFFHLDGHQQLLDILLNDFSESVSINSVTLSISIPLLSDLIPDATLRSELEPLLDFSGSPLSGVLWGAIGTLLSPVQQLATDVTNIMDALSSSTPDFTTALQDLVNMPADITNAFLNGYGDINPLTDLAALGISVPSLGFTPEVDLGGLLSPGGSLFDALGFDVTDAAAICSPVCSAPIFDFDVPSEPVGPIGSLVEMGQAIAEAIGWNGGADLLSQLF